MDWWVTEAGNKPIGPVTAELIVRGIEAGKVPLDALVCEVGGKTWRPLVEVEPFAAVAARTKGEGRGAPPAERTLVDVDFSVTDEAMSLRPFDGTSERTVVEDGPPDSTLARIDFRGDDGEERTIVEQRPSTEGS